MWISPKYPAARDFGRTAQHDVDPAATRCRTRRRLGPSGPAAPSAWLCDHQAASRSATRARSARYGFSQLVRGSDAGKESPSLQTSHGQDALAGATSSLPLAGIGYNTVTGQGDSDDSSEVTRQQFHMVADEAALALLPWRDVGAPLGIEQALRQACAAMHMVHGAAARAGGRALRAHSSRAGRAARWRSERARCFPLSSSAFSAATAVKVRAD